MGRVLDIGLTRTEVRAMHRCRRLLLERDTPDEERRAAMRKLAEIRTAHQARLPRGALKGSA